MKGFCNRKTCVRLWQYLAEFFLEWEMLQTKVVDKLETHFLTLIIANDRPCGLVVRVSGYRYRGPGFDPQRYQIF